MSDNPYPKEGKTISNLGFLQGCAWNEGYDQAIEDALAQLMEFPAAYPSKDDVRYHIAKLRKKVD